jgi:aspartyl-tRNA(Asn)/glutamyl-tRNA(Gln) amidotransferase subunit A
MNYPNWDSIEILVKKVESKKITAQELVKESLKRAKSSSEYNVFIAINEDSAIKRAKEIDANIKAGKKVGRLAGVPFIAKDNFLMFGPPTTAASNMLSNYNATYQATAINKLEAEGAICIGKANLDAFAHGSSTENSYFGPTKNPIDITRVPGGSSGGSGAGVALNIAPFALGTDTGGSIRLPASFCGVVGLKPTYGIVSRYGVVAMASSTDVIGPLARCVDDAALVLDIMSGQDQFDGTTIERNTATYVPQSTGFKGKKIGLVKEWLSNELDPNIKKIIADYVAKAESMGAIVSEVSAPSLELALAVYYIIVPAEVSSNLSRYDGMRYGLSGVDKKDLTSAYTYSRDNGFMAENKRRIMIGTYVLSSGYYDAYYKKAQTVRTKIIKELNELYNKVDFLIGPTAPMTAFKLGENVDDPLKMYLTDVMTVSANLAGVPSISIPAGEIDGLPVGMQIMAAQRKDKDLLEIAKAFEDIK